MIVVIERVLVLAFFAIVGYILSTKKLVDSRHSRLLSVLIAYIFYPCNIFKVFAVNMNVDYIKNHYVLLVTAVIVFIVLAFLLHFVSRLFSEKPYEQFVYYYSMLIPSYGYFSYNLAETLYGIEVLFDVMVFAIPSMFYIYGIGICRLTKTPMTIKTMFCQPSIITMIAGSVLGVLRIPLPNVVINVLDTGRLCLSPIAMLLTGMAISEYDVKELLLIKKHYAIVVIRLIIIPVLLVLLLRSFCSKQVVMCALLLYIPPCGLNTVVYARLVNENCKIGASLGVISNALACFTIPILIHILL